MTTSLYASVIPHFTQKLFLSRGLRIGYTDEGNVWQFLAPFLLQRLPLRNIEWRNLVGVTKCIEQLPLEFVEICMENVTQELPLNCFYLVKCEDLDHYKDVVRPALFDWINIMTNAQVDWLILYVPLGTRPKAAGRLPNSMYKKIFDKIRADFGQKRSSVYGLPPSTSTGTPHFKDLLERVCTIQTLEGTSVIGQQQQHESQWATLLLKLKMWIMDAFGLKCFQYEEELKGLDTKRRASGWNVGAFLVAKERVALMYQQMYLQDDAIRHLDELDAIFLNLNDTEKQMFQDGSKNSFKCHDNIFKQSPLALDLYTIQQDIASNRASARLVSLYCFCRQIRTLYVMGNLLQLLKRASLFIEFFLAELKELAAEGKLDWHQPFLWAVGACMEVSCACELSWSGHNDQWTTSSVSVQAAQAIPADEMSRALGNILYLARRVLKKYAKLTTFRNERDMTISLSSNMDEAEASMTWYDKLREVFVSPDWRRSETCDSYERCLLEVSHLASMHFTRSGRRRFAAYLEGECAQHHFARGESEIASQLLRSLARQSEKDGWWKIFGACVRSICRSELALGQSAQAVAAWFSKLKHAQDEQVGVSDDGMNQVLIALMASFESRDGAGKAVKSLEKDMKKPTIVPKINMGELFRSSVTVETTRASGYVPKHGDIRVTLNIANNLLAEVKMKSVCIRFCKCNHFSKSDNVVGYSCEEHEYDTELLLEEKNVCLDKKTGVQLVLHHLNVPAGRYTCFGIECVIAGTTFHLLPPGARSLASFEIIARESTVQVDIDGAPLLMPGPSSELETIAVNVRANDDIMMNGLLEVRVLERTCHDSWNNTITRDNEEEELEEDRNGSREKCGIQLIGIQQFHKLGLDSAASVENTRSNHGESHGKPNNLLSVALPTLLRGGSLRYVVTVKALSMGSTRRSSEPESENDETTNVTVRASVRYHRDRMNSSSHIPTTEMRCTESTFRVLRPLAEVVQLWRIGTTIFASIALVCNPFVCVVLRDYHLRCPGQVDNADCPVMTVEQDPNTKLRGTSLRPNDRVYFAFTLACSPAFANKGSDSYCSLDLDLVYGTDETRIKSMTIRVPLTDVDGICYRIDVLPRIEVEAYKLMGEMVEATVSEPLTFDIHVQEEVSHPNKATLADNTDILYLCLDDTSEHDWILVGKQRERFGLSLASGSHANCRREFRTQKRLLATRSGTLRFPSFHLELNGQIIPAARVYCQHSSRQVLVL